jgi:hypothetical protein
VEFFGTLILSVGLDVVDGAGGRAAGCTPPGMTAEAFVYDPASAAGGFINFAVPQSED